MFKYFNEQKQKRLLYRENYNKLSFLEQRQIDFYNYFTYRDSVYFMLFVFLFGLVFYSFGLHGSLHFD